MPQLMLINPRKRKASRKPRTAAQKAATRKMLAANRSRRRPARSSHAAPAHNPIRRKRRTLRALAHHTGPRRRARRNPIGLSAGGIMGNVMASVEGAAGAIAVDYAMGMVGTMLPASLATGYANAAVRIAAAALLGTFGKKFLGRTAEKMAVGSMTVTSYLALRDMLGASGPTSMHVTTPMNGLGYMSPAIQAGYLPQSGMGEYTRRQPDMSHLYANSGGMGEYTY